MRVFELLDHLRIQGIKFETVEIFDAGVVKTYLFKGIANPRKDKYKNFIDEINDYKFIVDRRVTDWEVQGIKDDLAQGMGTDTYSSSVHLKIVTGGGC